MTTKVSALNGLDRAIAFCNQQLESSSAMYQSRVETFKEIQEKAQELDLLCSQILKVSSLVKRSSPNLEITSQIPYDKLLDDISTVVVDKMGVIQLSSDLEISKPAQEKPARDSSKRAKYPAQYSKKFKRVLAKVGNISPETSEYPVVFEFANLVKTCFDVRFNPKYDPEKIHSFNLSEFKNYLYSYVVSFSQSVVNSSTGEYFQKVNEWLDSVKSGKSKYTLPSNVGSVYVDLFRNGESFNTMCSISEQDVEACQTIWKILWDSGYNQFVTMLKDDEYDKFSDLIPSSDCNWVHTL